MAILAVLLPLLVLSGSSRANPVFDPKSLVAGPQKINYRLPGNSVPVAYDITITPDLKTFTFEGTSKIEINVPKKTRDITLHARDLDIKSVELSFQAANTAPKPVPLLDPKFELVAEKDFLVIKTAGDLNVGTHILTLTYKGVLNDNLRGFYRSKYTDNKGKIRWLAVTQFEPTSARLAFPCYDEPALKATFQITIKHDEKLKAVSNTPIDGKPSITNKIQTTKFQKTPKMSSYLIAFAVSDYEFAGTSKFGVWTKPPSIDDTKYALTVGEQELEALGEITGIDYYGKVMNMKKMDQISVPDFSAGAMENWGLVTYRESALLYNEKLSTAAAKQSISTIIAHEFTHQWFGNLVSPKWWTYVWLNEGFATYFQYIAASMVEDKWRLPEQFVVTALQQTALAYDSSENARPMNSEVGSPVEISSLFDSISYQKAGSVIRMMDHILTNDVFMKGLQHYLNANKNGAATSDDLFESLQNAVNETKKPSKDFDVAKTMDNWVNKAGYPIVSVVRDSKSKKMVVTQEQFPIPQSDVDNKWYVPINYATGDKPDFSKTETMVWLEPKDDSKVELDVKEDTWVIVNKQQTGYYRVNYDAKNWELITKHLKGENYTKIHVLNRAQLIDDAFSLARIGKLSYNTVLELLSYLQQEKDYIAWVPAYRGLDHLNKMLVNSKQYPKFQQFVSNQLKAVAKELKFERNENDTHIDTLNRVNVLKWSCAVGNKDCKTYVAKQLDAYIKDSSKTELDVNLKNHILCAAVRDAKQDKWDKVFDKYKSSKDQKEKAVLLSALGCSQSKVILEKFAAKIFNKTEGVQDPDTAFTALLVGNTHGVDIGLATLKKNIKNIREMEGGENMLKSYVSELGRRITTVEQQTKLGLLVAGEDIPKDASAAAIQDTFKNIYWVDSYGNDVEKWLNDHVKEEKEEKGDKDAANSATFATLLIVLPILITRFY